MSLNGKGVEMSQKQVSALLAEEESILRRNVGRRLPLGDLVRVQEIQDTLAAEASGEPFGV